MLDVEGRQHALEVALEVALERQPGVVMTLKPDPLVVVVRLGALVTTDRAIASIDGYLTAGSEVQCIEAICDKMQTNFPNQT